MIEQGTINKKFVNQCQEIVLETANAINHLNKIEDLHKLIDKKEINNIRIESFKAINTLEWEKEILESCYSHIAKMLGPDLLIQKKINLSIQMPDDESSVLEAHSDCSSGDSPFELVIWIPLTECYDTNSMFVLDKVDSNRIYKKIKASTYFDVSPKNEDFIVSRPGEYIVFPPTLIHGNMLNRTDITRASLNVRVKSVFSPYTKDVVRDRTYGTYYKRFAISKLTEWNMTIYETLT